MDFYSLPLIVVVAFLQETDQIVRNGLDDILPNDSIDTNFLWNHVQIYDCNAIIFSNKYYSG